MLARSGNRVGSIKYRRMLIRHSYKLLFMALLLTGSGLYGLDERRSFKEELSFSNKRSYFAKRGWQNGLSEMTQSRQRLPWKLGTWDERVENFLNRVRKGDRKAFLYVGYGLLDGYGNPYTHQSARSYPTSVGSVESRGVIWKLYAEAKRQDTTIERVLTQGKAKVRKRVLRSVLVGLHNKDPRVRLVAINLLRRLRPEASIYQGVKRALLLETVTTERAKWRPRDLDIPSVENPRLGWRAVASSGGGTPYYISDRYKDGSSGGLEDLLNGNGKGSYLSSGLYRRNERNDYVTVVGRRDYSTGREQRSNVWTKASLLRYGADTQISGFEAQYRLGEVEAMPRHVYLYIDYRNPGSEVVGESAYYAYHSVWEEMKKLELFVARALWVSRVKSGDKALRTINKDAFRALADQIDGESIRNVPMKSPGFKIFGEKEVKQIIEGMLWNHVVSTREECVRFLKRLYDRPETSVAVRKRIKKSLREARKRELIVDTIRGRHLHAELIVPKQPDDWWGESDEVDTSSWGKDREEKLQLYRNQVEFPEETDIIYHSRRKPGQEEDVAEEIEDELESEERVDAGLEERGGINDGINSSVEIEQAKIEQAGDGAGDGAADGEIVSEGKGEGESGEGESDGGLAADEAGDEADGDEAGDEAGDDENIGSGGSGEEGLLEEGGYSHPLFRYVKDGRLSFRVIDGYLSLGSFISGQSQQGDTRGGAGEGGGEGAGGGVDPGQEPGLRGSGDIKSVDRSKIAQYYEQVRAVETLHSLLLANVEDILKASYIDLQNAFLILLKIEKEFNQGNVGYDFLSYFMAGAEVVSVGGRRFHGHESLALELSRGKRARDNLQSLMSGIKGSVRQYGLRRGNIASDETGLKGIRNKLDTVRENADRVKGDGNEYGRHGEGGYYGYYDQQKPLGQAEDDKEKIRVGFYQFPPQWKAKRGKIVEGLLGAMVSKDPQKRLLIIHMLRRLIPGSSMLSKVNKLLRELETVDKSPYLFFDTKLEYGRGGEVYVKVQEKIVGHELLKLQRFIVRRVLVNKIRSGGEADFLQEMPKGSFLTLVVRIDAEWDPYRVPLRTPIPRMSGGRNGMFFTKQDIDVIRGGLDNRNFLVQREVAKWMVLFYEYNRTVTKHIGDPVTDGYARKFVQGIKDAERRDIVYYERNYVQWKYNNETFSKTEYVGKPEEEIVKKKGASGIPVGRVGILIGSVTDADIFALIDEDRRKEYIDRYGKGIKGKGSYKSFVEEEVPSEEIGNIRGDVRRSYRMIKEGRDKEKSRLGDPVRDDNSGLDYKGN